MKRSLNFDLIASLLCLTGCGSPTIVSLVETPGADRGQASCVNTAAHGGQWEQTGGPAGGTVSGLRIGTSSTGAKTLYAVSGGGVLRWDRCRWTLITPGFETHSLKDFVALPGQDSPEALFFAGSGGVFRSSDQGVSWVDVGSEKFGRSVTGFAAVGSGPNERLFVTSDKGVFTRSPSGVWTEIGQSLVRFAPFQGIAAAWWPGGPLAVQVWTPVGLFSWLEKENRWDRASFFDDRPVVKVFHFAPGHAYAVAMDPLLWLWSYPVLAATHNQGAEWETINVPSGAYPSTAVVQTGASGSETLILGTQTGTVIMSADRGKNWTELQFSNRPLNSQCVEISPDFHNDGLIYVTTPEGYVLQVDTRSKKESFLTDAVPSSAVRRVAISAGFRTDRTLLAATARGVFLSTDAGASWVQRNQGLPSREVYSLFLPAGFSQHGQVYAGTDAGVFFSEDRAGHWQRFGKGLDSRRCTWLAGSPVDSGTDRQIWAGTDTGLYSAPSDGRGTPDWNLLSEDLKGSQVNSLAVATAGGSGQKVLFAATSNGVAISVNHGSNWQWVKGIPRANVLSVAVAQEAPAKPPLVLAGTAFGLYTSQDMGGSWKLVNLPQSHHSVSSIATGKTASGAEELYAGTVGGGVFLSADGGQTWQLMPSALGGMQITDLVSSWPEVFAATLNRGVLYYSGDARPQR